LQLLVFLVLEITQSAAQVEVTVNPAETDLSSRLLDTVRLHLVLRLVVLAQFLRFALEGAADRPGITSIGAKDEVRRDETDICSASSV
jgi:hypothetical protein